MRGFPASLTVGTKMKKKLVIYLICILPALLLYSFALLIPLIFGTIPYSTYNWNLMSGVKEFIGLKNYLNLFSDKDFFRTLLFTLKIGVTTIVISNVLAFVLAYFLSKNIKGKSVSRAFFFIPNIISAVLVAFIWYVVFAWVIPSFADAVNWQWLKSISWFGETSHATFAIIVVSVWQGLGFALLIYIAGFQTIPPELIEAASIDGCTGIKSITKVQLPLLMSTITINLFISIAAAFKAFDIPFALTDGGPFGTTQTIALNVYQEAFIKYKMGMGSAKSVVLFLIVTIITIIQLKITSKKEVEY